MVASVANWSITLCLALLVAAGCTDSDSGANADLPSGWEGAKKIADFTQMECDGGSDESEESIAVEGVAGGIELAYDHARFRCSQDVEGFARRSEGQLDILIQPVDMNPSSVAKCDCTYDIVAKVAAAAGEHTVTVYRRPDNIGGEHDPVKVDSADVVVPD
jgi:hypothetical protein